MKSIGARFLVPFVFLAVLISAFVFYRTYAANREHTLMLVGRQADIAMEFNLAIRDYAAGAIRPAFEAITGKDVFRPEVMSTSFISRKIFEEVRRKFPSYLVRFSSDHPRNPDNMANVDELKVIEFFRRNTGIDRRTEEIQIDGKRYVARFSPKWVTQECLRCHSDPKEAPLELVERYGDKAGFHKILGDVAGLDTIAVPLDAINSAVAAETRSDLLILAVGLTLLFGTILLVFRFVVSKRLGEMARHFDAISKNTESPSLAPLEIKGNNEISAVCAAFNRLVEQLRETHSTLEDRVAARTEELSQAYERLMSELVERRRAESALQESQQRLADIVNFLPDATLVINNEGKVIAWNKAIEEMTGIQARDILGKGDYEYAIPFYGERRPILIDLVLERHEKIEGEYIKLERKDNVLAGEAHMPSLILRDVYLSATAGILNDSMGNIVGAIESIRDITESKQAEFALAESEHRFFTFMENLPAAAFIKSFDGRVLFANSLLRELFAWDQPIGKTTEELLPPDIAVRMAADDRKAFEEGPRVIEERIIDTHGAYRDFDTFKFPIVSNGAGAMLGGIAIDVTERKRAEEALRESEEKYRAVIETTGTGYVILDTEGRVLGANSEYLRLTGYGSLNEILGRKVTEWTASHDCERNAAEVQKCVQNGSTSNLEIDYVDRENCRIPVEISATALTTSTGVRIVSLVRDISERKKAEEDKERLEAKFLQAQKMESIGRLAGGVAHDFNNMLGVIIGYSEMAMDKVGPSDPLYRDIEEILNAGRRSAELTRHLLAFARKQTVSPQVLDLNDTISGMFKMLQRLIGEDIDLSWHPGHNLWKVHVDPSQIDQILANLAVNSRDAISGIGSITLRTENATVDGITPGPLEIIPGDYVLLTVSDTGAGMTGEILDHIFEPFFTTKEMGSGTGLGLSTVYGVVKQNGGAIYAASSPGAGATFSIYLPRYEDQENQGRDHNKTTLPVKRGDETILLVEDDASVLSLSEKILSGLGYKVILANNPETALEVAESTLENIHLMVTDVIMPQMSGKDLCDRIRSITPSTKCLFMSGYTSDMIANRGVLDSSVNLINKPFSKLDLANKVREVLEQD